MADHPEVSGNRNVVCYLRFNILPRSGLVQQAAALDNLRAVVCVMLAALPLFHTNDIA